MAYSRLEAAEIKVFERMKAVYLTEVGRKEAENKPSFETLSREYDEAIDSEDPVALQQWIDFRGEESFHRVVSQRLQQARRRMAKGG